MVSGNDPSQDKFVKVPWFSMMNLRLKVLTLGSFAALFIGCLMISIFSKDFATYKFIDSEFWSRAYSDLRSISPVDPTHSHSVKTIGNNLIPWITADYGMNYSSKLVDRWLTRLAGESCKNSKTVGIKFLYSKNNDSSMLLSTGDIHDFVFQAIDEAGNIHCLGGDYFETDLSGERWKSRPPIQDMGNGSHKFSLQIHPDFAGDYNLTIILLFRHYDGFTMPATRFVFDKVVSVIPIKFYPSTSPLPEITQCRSNDYSKDVWSGRWTRHAKNDSCPISDDGRYRCQKRDFPCENPWCEGPLGSIESNGWVYSAHCSFKMFTKTEAWKCLKNRWIFWWGDSNHCDTIRNLLNFILDLKSNDIPRIFDSNITNPEDHSQVVRFTSIFNGHPEAPKNGQGLNSLNNSQYRNLVKSYFGGEVFPNTIIMNSGLHDAMFWPNITSFIMGVEYAASFWREVVDEVQHRGGRKPEIIYRTTVASAGSYRIQNLNPQKVEAYNGVMLEKLRKHRIIEKVVDDFDITFPWHYDTRCSDGIHYGRAPWNIKWVDGIVGHQYFVDLMLAHVLLNTICII